MRYKKESIKKAYISIVNPVLSTGIAGTAENQSIAAEKTAN